MLRLISCRSRRTVKKMSVSVFAAKTPAIQTSFEEKVNNCLENIVEFSSLIKHIHGISGCDRNCEVGYFSDELYRYLDSKIHSPRLIIIFFFFVFMQKVSNRFP